MIKVNNEYRFINNNRDNGLYVIKGAWDGRHLDKSHCFLMHKDGKGHAFAGKVTHVADVWNITEEEFSDMCGGHAEWFKESNEQESNPKSYTPSQMDLEALESLRTGREGYNENGTEIRVINICRNMIDSDYFVRETKVDGAYWCKKFSFKKPIKDLTPQEVVDNLGKEVWVWNDSIYLAIKIKLKGFEFLDGNNFLYKGKFIWYKHASLEKPE
jgi:hypothetical protein